MSQSLTQNLIHIIFSTKNREPFLADPRIRGEMHAYLKGICNKLRCPSLRVGGVADHVHILCRLSKNITGSDLVREIKKGSSKWIKTKGGRLNRFYWQGGYAYFSVSPIQRDRVIHYIDHQEQHHEKMTFQDEYRKFLDQYEMEYEERYVWD